ncbi:unnamed protein product [Blepharisma stoltei]|uniref:Tetratricopeptide repeat protein n=1 Tax=Blepharisma stoltei TaxID=1481888 RepID=A0AAU9KGX2_9CILI|nr:unnamed protein product [Blepharisma stoltei]
MATTCSLQVSEISLISQQPKSVNCPIKTPRKHPLYPIPRKESPYSWAKKAEYIEKNLEKAEFYYKAAISNGERVESSVKDLAGVLHQQGKTQEACELLLKYQHLFSNDATKFENLLESLKKQVVPTGNSLNKNIKISGSKVPLGTDFVKSLFLNFSRIKNIEVKENCAILHFSSHSAARKTIETYRSEEILVLEWINSNEEVIGPVILKKRATDFSLFAGEKAGAKLLGVGKDYTYFPEQPVEEGEDLIDDLLKKSILSYFTLNQGETNEIRDILPAVCP